MFQSLAHNAAQGIPALPKRSSVPHHSRPNRSTQFRSFLLECPQTASTCPPGRIGHGRRGEDVAAAPSTTAGTLRTDSSFAPGVWRALSSVRHWHRRTQDLPSAVHRTNAAGRPATVAAFHNPQDGASPGGFFSLGFGCPSTAITTAATATAAASAPVQSSRLAQ